MLLTPSPVKTASDIELVRLIRNEGCASLSHDAREISREEQAIYWQENQHRLRAYLYEDESGEVVAAGSLRRDDDGRLWAWVAVEERARGHHYSVEILKHLVSEADGEDVWGQNRLDNPPSFYMCIDMGKWLEVSRDGNVVTVVYRKEYQS